MASPFHTAIEPQTTQRARRRGRRTSTGRVLAAGVSLWPHHGMPGEAKALARQRTDAVGHAVDKVIKAALVAVHEVARADVDVAGSEDVARKDWPARTATRWGRGGGRWARWRCATSGGTRAVARFHVLLAENLAQLARLARDAAPAGVPDERLSALVVADQHRGAQTSGAANGGRRTKTRAHAHTCPRSATQRRRDGTPARVAPPPPAYRVKGPTWPKAPLPSG